MKVVKEKTDGEYNLRYLLGISLVSAMGGLLFGYDLVVIGGAKEFYELVYNLSSPAIKGWAVSSCIVGCIIGALCVGKPADVFGRKKLLIVSAAMFFVSAIGSGYAPTFTQFVLYRLLGGIGMGFASTLSPMYIAEVSPASLRGRFVSLNQMTIVIGILLAQLVNYLILQSHPVPEGVEGAALLNTWNGQTGWRWMFAAEGIPALLFFALMFTVPNSPRWLCRAGRTEKAVTVMEKVGGAGYAGNSLASILETFDEKSRRHEVRELLKPRMRKILLIGIVLAVFQQWCGINVVFNYAHDIFKAAGYNVSGVLFNLVIVGITNFAFTIVAMFTVDKIGRKSLLLWGSAGLAISFGVVGLFFHLNVQGILVLLMVLAALACFAATLGPVVWVVISEIFPNRIRGLATSIAVLSLWIGNFVLSYTFPIIQDAYSIAATFWIYAVVCVLGVVFIRIYIPETKGKTLEQIEANLLDENLKETYGESQGTGKKVAGSR
ncbi:D-xylose transporter [Anaerohalosphaera lusitana]|uniref:D-xylose transporter n=1 Tax=Anaerohalosphaera lusitana TaxID=1936003 RepID=A0A1U9NMM0_9BACT|nr:sugar porter family MFS transporter [Anaerohalosphaera lusitana]AQT69047.1 D-xylose transporter [Anaerohalosphaera lusitana]